MQIEPLTTALLAPTPAVVKSAEVEARTEQTLITLRSNSKSEELSATFPAKDDRDVEEKLRFVDEAIKSENISLKFSRDEETGTIIIEMVDQTSGETLRKIPDETLLRLSAALGKLQGLIISRQV